MGIEQRVRHDDYGGFDLRKNAREIVNEWHDCEVPRGFVGLEAEGYRIEFRNVKVKPL